MKLTNKPENKLEKEINKQTNKQTHSSKSKKQLAALTILVSLSSPNDRISRSMSTFSGLTEIKNV